MDSECEQRLHSCHQFLFQTVLRDLLESSRSETQDSHLIKFITDVKKNMRPQLDLELTFYNEMTPLFKAVKKGDPRVVSLVLDFCGGNVHHIYNKSAFKYAIVASNYLGKHYKDIAEILMRRGYSIRNLDLEEHRDELLFAAIENSTIPMIDDIIKQGADVNRMFYFKDGFYFKHRVRPLHLAATKNSLEICQLLIQRGADINALDQMGYSAMQYMMTQEMIKLFLTPQVNISNIKFYPGILAYVASDTEHRDVLFDKLLTKCDDINITDVSGNTVLHLTDVVFNDDVAKFLIEKGAYVNVKNNEGKTPLHQALLFTYPGNNIYGFVKALIENNADVNIQDNYGCTPLHNVWIEDYSTKIDIVKMLLEKGADTEIKNNIGRTPLHIFAEYHSSHVLQLLINHNANVNVSDENGVTPLHLSMLSDDEEKCLMLLRRGADANAATTGSYDFCKAIIDNETRVTPMHLAVLYQNIPDCDCRLKPYKLLWKYGGDANAQTSSGLTPMHLVFHRNESPRDFLLIKDLIDTGCDINIKCNNKKTPIEHMRDKRSYKFKQSFKREVMLLKFLKKDLNAKYFEILELDELEEGILRSKFQAEFDFMKSIKIGDSSKHFHEILTYTDNQLAYLSQNETVLKTIRSMDPERLPMFYWYLLRRIEMGVKRYGVLIKALQVSGTLKALPYVCKDKILDYLTTPELRDIVRAGEYRNFETKEHLQYAGIVKRPKLA